MAKPLPGIPERFRDPRIEADPETVSDADTVKAFHTGSGKIGITIGANALVALITAGLTYLGTHHDAQPVDCASKADMSDLRKEVSDVKQGLANYVEKSGHDADRSHNDLELLKLKLDVVTQRLGK